MLLTDGQLIQRALELLRERLPSGWSVERADGREEAASGSDAIFTIASKFGGSSGALLVEARQRFSPADVDRLMGGLTRRLRATSGDRPILLASEFISPRARELLAREDISYVDLTGNTRLVMHNPAIFVETSGADRQPRSSASKRSAGLSGAAAGRVIRFLAEAEPPYGVLDIEAATGISRGYVSRILDRLSDEALIIREPRGPVTGADWPAMLRLRGQSVDLFRANTTRGYVCPSGARDAFERLASSSVATKVVVTGSFAAVQTAPVAAPALFAAYLDPANGLPFFDEVQQALGLLPTEDGADVVLLWPSNNRAVEDTRNVDGIRLVNLPQLVVDCLGGSGRMPAEGEAVLDWMQTNDEWRAGSRSDLGVSER